MQTKINKLLNRLILTKTKLSVLSELVEHIDKLINSVLSLTMSIKVESGLQLLSRLTKRPRLENFFPLIFGDGPKSGDFIEIYSENSTNCLLAELISESLIPLELDGPGTGTVIFNTDGNLDINDIINLTKNKLLKHKKRKTGMDDVDQQLNSILKNIYIFNIYDENQFYISIHKLENLLLANPNISLIVFDTLTAFYWCEQTFKITKMDLYIKKLLQVIQKVIKDSEVIVLYSRPENFSSTKEPLENLEACCKQSKEDQLNYRIQIVYKEDGFNHVNVRTHNRQFKKNFQLINDELCWL